MKLAGIREIADLLGVSRQRANQIAAKNDFPKPLDRIAAGPVWRDSEVKAWAKGRGSSSAEVPEGGTTTSKP
jgi:predicted DNA-binding transcriptional regulator AlpA